MLQQINQLAQEQLAAVGIKLKLEPVAQSEWYDRLVKRNGKWLIQSRKLTVFTD